MAYDVAMWAASCSSMLEIAPAVNRVQYEARVVVLKTVESWARHGAPTMRSAPDSAMAPTDGAV